MSAQGRRLERVDREGALDLCSWSQIGVGSIYLLVEDVIQVGRGIWPDRVDALLRSVNWINVNSISVHNSCGYPDVNACGLQSSFLIKI